MAIVNGYATLAELREHLGDGSSLLTTATLERAIHAASRAVDHHCDRGIDGTLGRFWADAAVAQRTYLCDSAIETYVDDISTRTGLIVETGTDGAAYGTTWTTGTDFILEPRNAGIVGAGSTADAHAFWKIVAIGSKRFLPDCYKPTLRVTARFGWSGIPTDVNEATILKAASLFKRKDAPFGVAGFGDFGVVRIGRNDPDVIELLSSYRAPVAG
jgi:hypothetical protein